MKKNLPNFEHMAAEYYGRELEEDQPWEAVPAYVRLLWMADYIRQAKRKIPGYSIEKDARLNFMPWNKKGVYTGFYYPEDVLPDMLPDPPAEIVIPDSVTICQAIAFDSML